MQRRRASRTSISACFVVNTRLRRSLLNRLCRCLLSRSLSRRSLRGHLLGGRLRSYRCLLNRFSLLRGSLRNRSRRRLCGRYLSSRSLRGSLSRRNRRRGYRRGRRLRRIADALGVGEELGVAETEGDAEADVDDDEAEGVTFGARTDEEQPVSSRSPARTPAVAA